MRQPRPVGRHAVGRSYRPQRDRFFVCTKVAHHADRLDRQKNRERLPYILIYSEIMKLLDKDPVCLLKKLDFFRRNVTENADRKPGTGKRMAFEDHFRNAEVAAYFPHFVLK